jgi:hypothetical protein
MVVREAAAMMTAMYSPAVSAGQNMYCNVQYIIGRSDYNSIEPVMQSIVKE